MIIRDAQFITSVAHENNFLKSDRPIVAVAGKSNVGKSSFINMLANRKKLAKTSNTPGRTRLVNTLISVRLSWRICRDTASRGCRRKSSGAGEG